MTDHADILRRLEGASAPARELDRDVAECAGWERKTAGMSEDDYWRFGDMSWTREDEEHPPRYTASLDAAIALAERMLRADHPHMTVNLKGIYSGDRVYWYAEITWPSSERQGRGYTPIIALLIALFRALEAGK